MDKDYITHPLLKHPLDKKRVHSNAVNRYIKRRKQTDPRFHLVTLFQHKRSECKINGIEFNIEFADIPYTGICPVLGIEMSYNGARCFSPSLDRIDNLKSYVKGNVRWISHKANRWKNDMAYEDVKKLLDNFYKVV